MYRVFDRVGTPRSRGCLADFLRRTDGATTADFVMLSATVLGVGMAAMLSVGGGTSEAATEVGTEIAMQTPGHMTDGQYTSAIWSSPATGQNEFTTEANPTEVPEEEVASGGTMPTEVAPGDGITPQPSDPGTSSAETSGSGGGSVVVVSGGGGGGGGSGIGSGTGGCERDEEDESAASC